jgi:hypothetical protein
MRHLSFMVKKGYFQPVKFRSLPDRFQSCSEYKFNVRKCKNMRIDESYRLVTTVLVLNSHGDKIHNILVSFGRARGKFSTAMDIYDISIKLMDIFICTTESE